jgi:hypothetical protein
MVEIMMYQAGNRLKFRQIPAQHADLMHTAEGTGGLRVLEDGHEEPTVLAIGPKGIIDRPKVAAEEDLQVLAEANAQLQGQPEDLQQQGGTRLEGIFSALLYRDLAPCNN